MFAHLKKTREIEFERLEDSRDSSEHKESPKNKPVIIAGFKKQESLYDDQQRLIQEFNTPLSLPGASPKSGSRQPAVKLLPMMEIPEREIPEPEIDPKNLDQED